MNLARYLAGLGPERRARVEEMIEVGTADLDVFRLSPAQERFWFLHRLRPADPTATLPGGVRVTTALDAAVLARVLDTLARRHEALRTTFVEISGTAWQVVDPEPPALPLGVVDLEGLTPEAAEGVLERVSSSLVGRPFDLEDGPLLRLALARLPEGDSAVLLALHHIVGDAWSLGLLLREITALYGAFAAGAVDDPLAPLDVQYADFAEWQRERLDEGRERDLLDHWRQRLAEAPRLDLPWIRPPEGETDSRGASVSATLDAATTAALGRLAAAEDCTPFMVLVAAVCLLLGRLGDERDVVVGAPVAGRETEELERVVGLFLDTVPLRVSLDDVGSFRRLLARSRETILDAFEHRDLPFERLVQELAPRRDTGRMPLFDVLVNMINTPEVAVDSPGLAIRRQATARPGATYPLTLYAAEREGRLHLRLLYRRRLFDQDRAATLLGQLTGILDQAVAEPDGDPARYTLVGARLEACLGDFSAPLPVTAHRPVTEPLDGFYRTASDAPALTWRGETWSYGRLGRRVAAMVEQLRPRAPRGAVVGVEGTPSFELFAAIVAVLRRGAVLLALDPSLPTARRRQMVAAADVRLILTAPGATGDDLGAERLALAERDHEELPMERLERVPGPGVEDSAYVIFTSGTTGEPKGILGHHRALAHFLHWERGVSGIGPGDRIAQLTALSFDPLLRDLFLPLTSGATLCLPPMPGLGGAELLPWMAEDGITAFHATPSLTWAWTAGVERPIPLPALGWILFAGEPLTDRLVARWRRTFPGPARMLNLYGPAEVTMSKCFDEVTEPVPGVQPVGRSLPESQVTVLGANGVRCGVGEPGEIVFRTPHRTRGYLPGGPSGGGAFVPNPWSPDDPTDLLYRSGDRGRFAPDGRLEILGRVDHQVKVRGVRVEPQEVATVLERQPGVDSAAVVPWTNDRDETVLAAYFTARPDAEPPTAEGLEAALRRLLPEALVPFSFQRLDRLPVTVNGKLDRRALPPPGRSPRTTPGTSPLRDPFEEMVATIWSAVLEVPSVDADDDFFDLGGHSLLAMQAASRLRATFSVELPLAAVFEAPTPALMGRRVRAVQAEESIRAPEPEAAAERPEHLPLAFAQERLWFLHRLRPESPWYAMPVELELAGDLDRGALAVSLGAILERHEVLRTTYRTVDGRPVQEVGPAPPVALPVVDLAGLDPRRAHVEATRWSAERARRPFDLETSPPLRTMLLDLGDSDEARRRHRLSLVAHHVAADAWSMGLFVGELTELYRARLDGEAPELPALPLQVADFALWQRSWLDGPRLDRLVAAWRRTLDGAPAVLELPLDRPRPPVARHRGATVELALGPAVTEGAQELGRRRGATLFMVLLAAYGVLLSRLSGQDDVVVGTAIAGRDHRAFEGLIGMFVNSLPLRLAVEPEQPFGDLVEHARRVSLDAYALQDLPFERLVEALEPARDPSRAPIFQAMLVLQNAVGRDLDLGDVELATHTPRSTTARLDLSLSVSQSADGLRGLFELDRDLFDLATVERWSRHLGQLLAAAVERPHAPVASLDLLTPAERHQATREWARVERLDAPLFPERFARVVAEGAERVALLDRGRPVTYGELAARVERLTAALAARGLAAGDRVAVAAERGELAVAACLALWCLGVAYVPLDPAYPRQRLRRMVDDAAPALVLVDGEAGAAGDPVGDPTLGEWSVLSLGELATAGGGQPPEGRLHPELPAYVVFTSGSSGTPKGVTLSHRGLARLAAATALLGSGPGSRVIQLASPSFDASIFELVLALGHGAILVLEAPRDLLPGPALAATLTRRRATHLTAVGSTLAAFGPGDGDALEAVMACGEPTGVAHVERWGRGRRFLNLYGPTEATCWTTWEVWAGGAAAPAIGRPVPGARAWVADRTLRPSPPGAPGELLIGGDTVAHGYLGRPAATAERFVPDPAAETAGARVYRSGDLVRRCSDGGLEFLGRVDRQLKVRGFRIEPGEVETALLADPRVAEAVVTVEGAGAAAALVAWVVSAGEPGAVSPGDLRSALAAQLPAHLVPSRVAMLERMPVTANGKVALDRLAEVARTPADDVPRRAPANDLERRVLDLFLEVLELDEAGTEESFFELGGHSLLMIRLQTLLRERMDAAVEIVDLFSHPTAGGVARLVAPAVGPVAEPVPVGVAAGGEPSLDRRAERLRAGGSRLRRLRGAGGADATGERRGDDD